MARRGTSVFKPERSPARMQPQQRRAEETIERIKAAMIELVMAEGYAAISTNRIARHAGVNIASLYRYFPNRASIAMALYEEAAAELAQLTHQHLIGHIDTPLRTVLDQLLRAMLDFLDKKQIILMRLVDEVPELRESVQALELENLARNSSRIFLRHHIGAIDEASLDCKLFFVQHFAMGLIRRYVTERPVQVSRERFLSELGTLIVHYLHS